MLRLKLLGFAKMPWNIKLLVQQQLYFCRRCVYSMRVMVSFAVIDLI